MPCNLQHGPNANNRQRIRYRPLPRLTDCDLYGMAGMAVWLPLLAVSALLPCALTDVSYVYPGEAVPEDTIRLISLGTGTPSITKTQVTEHAHSENVEEPLSACLAPLG